MARRKLSMDVSISELLYMRNEENMSVKAIAERLDVSVATVYRYIGPSVKKETKKSKVDQIGSVGQAMLKALNYKYTVPQTKSIDLCATCVNRGVGCSLCLRNPLLKDYYVKGK